MGVFVNEGFFDPVWGVEEDSAEADGGSSEDCDASGDSQVAPFQYWLSLERVGLEKGF
jgi:hypothetical protein